MRIIRLGQLQYEIKITQPNTRAHEYESIKRIMWRVALQELKHMLSELKKPFCSNVTKVLEKNSSKLRGK